MLSISKSNTRVEFKKCACVTLESVKNEVLVEGRSGVILERERSTRPPANASIARKFYNNVRACDDSHVQGSMSGMLWLSFAG